MMLKIWIVSLICSLSCINFFPFSSTSEPICTLYTPHSILAYKEQYTPLFVAQRSRYATCTGVTWFHESYLAVLNLYGKKIDMYHFDPLTKSCSHIQEVTNAHGAELCHAENLVASPDGTLLIICSDGPYAGINIHTINQNHTINGKPIFSLKATNLVHNVKCSPDGAYVALACFDETASICVYKIVRNKKSITLRLVHRMPSPLPGLKAKGICFSKNKKYIVIAYCLAIDTTKSDRLDACIVSYSFDIQTGRIGKPISHIRQSVGMEDLALIDDDRIILASDQAHDTIIMFPFNSHTGLIDSNYTLLQNPQARLSFPHGLGVSPDGHYLAVTNYGNDSCSLYQI